jgi:hypothetical protein
MRAMHKVASALLLLAGCAHPVVIDSEPPGASVLVDGNLIGRTPVSFVDRGGLKRSYDITVKLDGYRSLHQVLTQQFQPTVLCCPVLIPVGWQLPEDKYVWPLVRDDGSPSPVPGMIQPPP